MNKILLGSLSLAMAVSLNATVFATVNGKNITEKELAPILQGIPASLDINKLPAATKKTLIDRAIQIQLLMQNAIKSGIEKDPIYKARLENVKKELALQAWQEKEYKKVKVSENEEKDFYNKNKSKFFEPAKFHARHILVKTKQEAQDIINSLKNVKKEDLNKTFEKIAKEKSIEPGANQSGGDLGWRTSNGLVKPFSDAAMSLKNGEYTMAPVQTRFGYHVILKLDSKKEKQLAFSDVKNYIENILKSQKFKQEFDKKAADLEKKAKVVYKVKVSDK